MALTAAQAAADYAAAFDRVGETIYIRRYSGSTPSRTHVDAAARARIVGYAPHELVGAIIQGDRRIVVLAADLNDAAFSLPVTDKDKVMVRGDELSIIAADDSTRRVAGTLIAIDIQARG